MGIPLIWVSFFTASNVPTWLDFKPFNCIICLSFWSSLIASLLFIYVPNSQPIISIICWGGIGSYFSLVAKKFLIKGF